MAPMATDTRQAARAQAIRAALRENAKTVWAIRLDERMNALGVSVQQLADGAGTTYQTIWKILKGELYPKEYLRIAIAICLGAEVERLFPMPDARTMVARIERDLEAAA